LRPRWLRDALQALEATQAARGRVVPGPLPGATDAVLVLGTCPEDALLAATPGDQGVVLCPWLRPAWPSGLDADPPPPLVAEPAVACAGRTGPGRSAQLQTEHERALLAARSPGTWPRWTASSGRTRTLRKAEPGRPTAARAPMARRPLGRRRAAAGAPGRAQRLGLAGTPDAGRQESCCTQRPHADFPAGQGSGRCPLQMERELAQLRRAAGSAARPGGLLAAAAQALPAQAQPSAIDFGAGELRLKGLNLTETDLADARPCPRHQPPAAPGRRHPDRARTSPISPP
jgi:general secretion pathway protein L